MRFTTKLLPSRSGNVGVLQLNNPKALHALTLDMIECLQDVLSDWIHDNSQLQAIVLKSTHDTNIKVNNNEEAKAKAKAKRPAFCAGGDVKAVWHNGMAQDPATTEFFWQEYQVNHSIATCPIPIVSFWDGVVMGGGVGLSIHGKYRVATEHTLFAMPETAIGLFPDVGSMYWMPRLLSSMPVARYLALTGQRIYAADLVYTGLATHYVPSKQLSALERALVDATQEPKDTSTNEDAVAQVLTSFHEDIPTGDCHLATHQTVIETAFSKETVEAIVESLGQGGDSQDYGFSVQTRDTLLQRSPTSLKVTLEGLTRGAAMTCIGEDLQMEYRMARASTLPGADFYEGVRAVLVDKDHAPKWNPATLEEVTPERVDEFFAPIDQEWPIPASKL